MNKFQRRVKGKHKFLRRLKLYGLLDEFRRRPDCYYAFKTSSTPCSCWVCRNEKFSRKIKHK